MDKIEIILKNFNSPDEDEEELINLIGLNEEEFWQMTQVEISNALNDRLFEVIDEAGWSNVKELAKKDYPVAYIALLLMSDRKEDIDEVKDIILHSENYKVSPLDLKELISRVEDINFLEDVVINSSQDKFVKNAAITQIINRDLNKGKEVLKSIKEPCAPAISPDTFKKMDDIELIRILLDNSKRFSIGTANRNLLIRKLYKQDKGIAKTYISDILDNPTKQCILKHKIGDYLQNLLINVNKVDSEYASKLATQMIDKFPSYNTPITNISIFVECVNDSEKIKEYLTKYRELSLDTQSIMILLHKLADVDKDEAVNYSKRIIASLDEKQIPEKMTCIISCKNPDFVKDCIEKKDNYGLKPEQIYVLLTKTDDPEYIINKIDGTDLPAATLYAILQGTNNEQLYMYSIKNASKLNLNTKTIYKMMAENLPVARSIKLLRSAESNKMDNDFKETFLNALIEQKNPNISGFIEKYIKNYKANKLEEDSLIKILLDCLKPELINTYLEAKETPIKESELKLLLYSNDREKILDLIFTGKIPLNEETKKIAVLSTYTIQDERTRKSILNRLKIEDTEIRSKIDIPPEMTVGIEIESVGKMSKEIQYLKVLMLGDWEAKKDGSLEGDHEEPGVEVTSPILHGDDPEINNKISHVANLLINGGQTVNKSCGGHIHIGADYFKDYESYQNLVDLWINCEQIFYIISNKMGEVPRTSIAEYAKPISKSFETIIEEGSVDFANIISLRAMENQLNRASQRTNGINFNNLSDYEKHTIEFRLPNGTIDPNTWIENINLFGNTLRKCKEITEIRKKDKDELTPEEKSELKVFNSLVFGDLNMDDRANILINFVLPENQQKVFKDRYFVNSKMLNLHNDVKQFLSNETFDQPIDIADIKEKLFEKEGRITGVEFALCTTVIQHEIQKMKGGLTHGY